MKIAKIVYIPKDSITSYYAAIFGVFFGALLLLLRVILEWKKIWNGDTIDVSFYVAPFVSGLIFSITFYVIRIVNRISEFVVSNEQIKSDINKIKEDSSTQSVQHKVLNQVAQYNEIAACISKNYLNNHYRAAIAEASRVEVSSKNLSIEFINSMWEELIQHQTKIGRSKSIIVDIVHTGNILFWYREDARISLEKQRRFIFAGGMVNRIVKGAEPVELMPLTLDRGIVESTAYDNVSLINYLNVFVDMVEHGIHVSYIKSDAAPEKDFCIVRLKVIDHLLDDMSMIWHMNGDLITKSELLIENKSDRYILQEYKDKWAVLVREVQTRGRSWRGVKGIEEIKSQ